LRVEIDEVFAGSGDLAGAVEQVARLGAQLLLQAALEAEVSEFLGRERYARQAGAEEGREGMRNGYYPTTIKTTAGPVTLERPKLRGTTERFASQLFGTGVLRTNALEDASHLPTAGTQGCRQSPRQAGATAGQSPCHESPTTHTKIIFLGRDSMNRYSRIWV